MTASGTCHKCDKTARQFYYTEPFNSGDGKGHQGYWHCPEHGPTTIDTSSADGPETPKNKVRLNRADRRKLMRETK